jgi:hypothetical protein
MVEQTTNSIKFAHFSVLPHFSVLSPFQRVTPFQRFIPISAFYPDFSVLSPFQRFIPISAFCPHFSFRFQFPFPRFGFSVLSLPLKKAIAVEKLGWGTRYMLEAETD